MKPQHQQKNQNDENLFSQALEILNASFSDNSLLDILIANLKDYAIVFLDSNGNVINWNKGAEALFGYKKKEILGKHFSLFYIVKDRSKHMPEKELQRVLTKGRSEDDNWLMRKDSSLFWASGVNTAIYDKPKKLLFLAKIIRDETEKMQHKQELQQQNEYLNTLHNIAVALMNRKEYMNLLETIVHRAASLVNTEHGYVYLLNDDEKTLIVKIGIGVFKNYLNYTIKKGEGLAGRVWQTGKVLTVEDYDTYTGRKDDFKKGIFHALIGFPLKTNNKVIGVIALSYVDTKRKFTEKEVNILGRFAELAAVALDNMNLYQSAKDEIKERKEKEIRLRKSELQYKSLFNSNIIGVFTSKFSGQFLEANDIFLKMIGYSRKELEEGKIHRDKITPAAFKNVSQVAIKDMLESGSAKPYEKIYMHKNGKEIPVLIGVSRLDNSQDICIGFVLDISKQKELERRKDEFIGIASHELKTPLTSIKAYMQILERMSKNVNNGKIETYIHKTNIYINKLEVLITDLLDVSKIQAGKLQFDYSNFDFNAMIQESIDSMQLMDADHTIIKKGIVKRLVYGDKNRLEQVVTNLLSNAIKYSPQSDKVEIQVSENTYEVKVAVKDYGVGIPKVKLEKIFEKFYRVDETSKRFSGLGIGLYISSEIIKRHGGKIWVESDFGKGSTFYFTLPLKTKRITHAN